MLILTFNFSKRTLRNEDIRLLFRIFVLFLTGVFKLCHLGNPIKETKSIMNI